MANARSSVLVVDDDIETLDALKDLLISGFPELQIRTESDPKKALESLRIAPVDLVIADFRMESMNGYEFLEKSHALAPDAKRILASGFPMPDASNKGIDLVLLKPLDTQPFLDRVSKLLALGN